MRLLYSRHWFLSSHLSPPASPLPPLPFHLSPSTSALPSLPSPLLSSLPAPRSPLPSSCSLEQAPPHLAGAGSSRPRLTAPRPCPCACPNTLLAGCGWGSTRWARQRGRSRSAGRRRRCGADPVGGSHVASPAGVASAAMVKHTSRRSLPFGEALDVARSVGLPNKFDCTAWCKNGMRPAGIPRRPTEDPQGRRVAGMGPLAGHRQPAQHATFSAV